VSVWQLALRLALFIMALFSWRYISNRSYTLMKAIRSKTEQASTDGFSSQPGPLFESELRDIYWAEKALTIAIPEMIKSATSEALKLSLESHLQEARKKVEQIFTMLGSEPEEGDDQMKVIVKEAKELLNDGSWCYERVTQSTARRKRLNTRRIYRTERVTRSAH
jgi:hypothetical protein